jgi:hypothetical protein
MILTLDSLEETIRNLRIIMTLIDSIIEHFRIIDLVDIVSLQKDLVDMEVVEEIIGLEIRVGRGAIKRVIKEDMQEVVV